MGQRTLSNTMEMGVVHQPIRGMAKFGGMNRAQMDGLIMMCNGHLFKGLRQLSSGKTKEERKAAKELRKQGDENKKSEENSNKNAE